MKMDWFISSIGTNDVEVSDDQKALMLVRAEEFLKVGRLSRDEWESLNDESKAIFLDAADRLSADTVKAISEGVRLLIDWDGLT